MSILAANLSSLTLAPPANTGPNGPTTGIGFLTGPRPPIVAAAQATPFSLSSGFFSRHVDLSGPSTISSHHLIRHVEERTPLGCHMDLYIIYHVSSTIKHVLISFSATSLCPYSTNAMQEGGEVFFMARWTSNLSPSFSDFITRSTIFWIFFSPLSLSFSVFQSNFERPYLAHFSSFFGAFFLKWAIILCTFSWWNYFLILMDMSHKYQVLVTVPVQSLFLQLLRLRLGSYGFLYRCLFFKSA